MELEWHPQTLTCRIMVTTNLTRPDVATRYGERLVSRWSDESARIVSIAGIDLRKRGAK